MYTLKVTLSERTEKKSFESFQKNCHTLQWTAVSTSSHDAILSDDSLLKTYALLNTYLLVQCTNRCWKCIIHFEMNFLTHSITFLHILLSKISLLIMYKVQNILNVYKINWMCSKLYHNASVLGWPMSWWFTTIY